jgi:hypothetical protein
LWASLRVTLAGPQFFGSRLLQAARAMLCCATSTQCALLRFRHNIPHVDFTLPSRPLSREVPRYPSSSCASIVRTRNAGRERISFLSRADPGSAVGGQAPEGPGEEIAGNRWVLTKNRSRRRWSEGACACARVVAPTVCERSPRSEGFQVEHARESLTTRHQDLT